MSKITNEQKKTLENSPIFNMSLSSKELFHSNFIAWMLEKYPINMGYIFGEILSTNHQQVISNVQREKKNIDISFLLGDTLVVIENKVKSISYKKQLAKYAKIKSETLISQKKYSQNLTKTKIRYILLSLKEPTFFEKKEGQMVYKINEKEWLYIGYKDFTRLIEEKLLSKLENGYEKYLIIDYISLIRFLTDELLAKINDSDLLNLYKKSTDENSNLNMLKKLRIHDFFQKSIFENFRVKIDEKSKNENFNIPIQTATFYTNQQGGFEMWCQKADINYGIQIQGSQYRQFILGKDGHSLLQKANFLLDKEQWFVFKDSKHVRIASKENRPRKQDGFQNDKNFCQYSKFTFIYKYVMLQKLECDDENALIQIILRDISMLANIDS